MSIVMNDVTVTAENRPAITILKNISCKIQEGKITLLIGKTGSGKSTMLDILAGIQRIKSGHLSFSSTPVWQGKRFNDEVRHMTGIVFQQPEQHLFARSVKGEFNYSLKPYRLTKQEKERRIAIALNTLKLAPEILKKSPLFLSGGEKRRVSLATTFATEPRWLFLDEPSSGLDPEALQSLIGFIQTWRERTGGGMVIATHDLDAFFPIADQVIVMKEGQLQGCHSPHALFEHPEILMQAGIGVPISLEIAQRLNAHGIEVPAGLMPAKELAKAIRTQLEQKGQSKRPERTQHEASGISWNDITNSQVLPTNFKSGYPLLDTIKNLDPRTKWIVYSLLSVGILFQQTWKGLIFATLVTFYFVLVTRVTILDLKKVVSPFLVFFILSTTLSGLRIKVHATSMAGVVFVREDAWVTGVQLYRIFLVMILGMLFPLTTSYLKMKRGLEKSLSLIPGMKVPAEAVALSTALMLRFIPMITQEVNRFSRIVRARGKSRTKPGSLRLKDVYVLMIPLLLSVFQLAENMALAMEVRGYKKIGMIRTYCTELKMDDRDAYAIMIGLALFFVLIFTRFH